MGNCDVNFNELLNITWSSVRLSQVNPDTRNQKQKNETKIALSGSHMISYNTCIKETGQDSYLPQQGGAPV